MTSSNVTRVARYLEDTVRNHPDVALLPSEWDQLYDLLLLSNIQQQMNYSDLTSYIHLWDILIHNVNLSQCLPEDLQRANISYTRLVAMS